MRILVINGPNINMLGIREPGIYGAQTYSDLLAFIEKAAREAGVDAQCFQSNHEGAIVDKIQKAYGVFDGIIINPAAYTHTSIAIPDALKAVGIPAVEVHLSDISRREAYRQVSYTSEACRMTIAGKGFEGYREAINKLIGG
jgi:3-dehydroquinate dehydratase-2